MRGVNTLFPFPCSFSPGVKIPGHKPTEHDEVLADG